MDSSHERAPDRDGGHDHERGQDALERAGARAGAEGRSEAQARIDEAFHRDKLGLPLTRDQLRIVQFLGNGFGCHSCPHPEST